MFGEKITIEERDGIAYLTINNPEKMNILDLEVYEELFAAFEYIEGEDKIRVVILSGKGDRAFICGQDISTFKISNPRESKKFLRMVLKMFTDLESLSKPVIAAVNGLALGGGTEILLACDMVVASEKARFGLPESGIGVTPLWGIIRLADQVGRQKAKELMMTGDVISADEALTIGLVNKVVPHESLLDAAEEMARKILTKAPLAIDLIKASVNRGVLAEGVAFSENASALFFETKDLKEGMDAFYNKRSPVFRGI